MDAKESAPEAPAAPPPDKGKRSRPTKSLPTDRITFSKQLDLLRAYAAASGPDGKPVTNKQVADLLKMADSTTSLANAFFTEVGFLVRTDAGFVPSQVVREFSRMWDWEPEKAAHKLAPQIRDSWFWQAIAAHLSFSPLDEKEALHKLADAASAAPEYERQLRTLLDYIETAGVAVREGGQIRMAAGDRSPRAETPITTPGPYTAPLPAKPNGSPSDAGVIEFSVSIRVATSEIAGWSAERIQAFFTGFAQVLAAKGAMDKSE